MTTPLVPAIPEEDAEAFVYPRLYWAVWDRTGNAPPCIAGSRVDAVELRDADETALPLVVVSPAFLRSEVLANLSAAQDCIIEVQRHDKTGAALKAAGLIMFAKLSIERGWHSPQASTEPGR